MTHETKLFAKEHYVFGTKESLASYHIPFEYLLAFLQKETNSKANISDITIEIAFFFFFFFFFLYNRFTQTRYQNKKFTKQTYKRAYLTYGDQIGETIKVTKKSIYMYT